MAAPLQNRQIPHDSLTVEDLDTSTSPHEDQFLSPPSSTQSMMSPPPHYPQEDDYFSSKRVNKRRQNKVRRPCPTPLVRSEDTGSGEALLGLSAGSGKSEWHNVESSSKKVDDVDAPAETVGSDPLSLDPLSLDPLSLDPLPLAPNAAGGQGGTAPWVEEISHGLAASHNPRSTHDPPSNQDDSYDPNDSPAVNSLRRLSQSVTQSTDSKRREFKHLSKTLTNKIGSVFGSNGKTSSWNVNQNWDRSDTSDLRKASTHRGTRGLNTSEDLSSNSKKSKAQRDGPRHPARITLRKATGAYPSNATTNAKQPSSLDSNAKNKSEQPAISKITSNLVSFQSQLDHYPAKSACQEDSHVSKRSTSLASRSSSYKTPRVKARFMSLSRISNLDQSQQYTLPAEPVLTVTNHYPTRVVASKPQSRSDSVSLQRAPFRFSVVQIVSRNSIHEVIWCEDETSSSEASSAPISPGSNMQARIKSAPPVIVDSDQPKTPLIAITTTPEEVSASPQANEKSPTVSFSDPTDAHKRLLSWSWDNPRPSIADLPCTSPESIVAAELRDRPSNVSMRRAGAADILAEGYFPHHIDHDSMPTEGDSSKQSKEKPRAATKKESDTREAIDRGLQMFHRRGTGLGSLHSTRVGSQSIGEKNGVKNSSSQNHK